ncbi:uncharacterized protein PAC_18568 [Phialocephala subalpina]|uniref:Methyltransferase type 11 domain-containing protein n=1 Tax=Phialocephala subalpina TaxID=576137 RepID=A0A1L7XUG4_9HELO|nr:uncharacterized protein PAC_18568 [Phialocephala subalpina]
MTGNESEPKYPHGKDGKSIFWYYNNIDEEVTPEFRKFLTAYSKVPDEKIILLVYEMAFDGAPTNNLYAVDIANHRDVGYDMFEDRQTFQAHFIEADILHPSQDLTALNSTVDAIYISKVFHQWDWATQLAALRSIIPLLKSGSMVVGFHAGAVGAGFVCYEKGGLTMGLHDEGSWTKLWEEAGRETGTKWDASQVVMRDISELATAKNSLAYLDEDCRLMDFVVGGLNNERLWGKEKNDFDKRRLT